MDLNGKRLADLFSGTQYKGQHQLTVNAEALGLADGSYFVGVKVGEELSTIKIIK